MVDMLTSFVNPGHGYKAAQNQLQDFYGQQQGYMNPFITQGMQGAQPMQNAMERMLNPTDLYNEWSQGYETSPAAQQTMQRAQESGLNAAGAMGLSGSTPALRAIQQGAGNIMQQDRQNYMQDLMNKYLTGANMAQNLYGMGQQAGTNMAGYAGQMAPNMAQMEQARQAAPGEMFGNFLGAGGQILGGMVGGGAMGGSEGMLGSALGGMGFVPIV